MIDDYVSLKMMTAFLLSFVGAAYTTVYAFHFQQKKYPD